MLVVIFIDPRRCGPKEWWHGENIMFCTPCLRSQAWLGLLSQSAMEAALRLLSKPYRKQDLAHTLREVLDGRNSRHYA